MAMVPFLKYKEGARIGKALSVKRPSNDNSNRKDAKGDIKLILSESLFHIEKTAASGYDLTLRSTQCIAHGAQTTMSPIVSLCTELTSNYAVKQHEESKHHKHRTAKYNKPRSQCDAKKCMQMLQKADYDRWTITFRTAHVIAKYQNSFAIIL